MTLSFGTDGVRGPAPEILNQRFVTCLATAASEILAADRWIVGRDTRESGPVLSDAIMSAIRRNGLTAVDTGVIPTPVVAYLSNIENSGGVVVSASHNPWTDNGVKIFAPGGRKLRDEEQAMIEKRLNELLADTSAITQQSVDPIQHADPTEAWINSIIDALGNRTLEGAHLVVDCANGSASRIAEPLFNQLGARVDAINNEPDGRNINQGCGSTSPQMLAETVKSSGADLGLALDGDADRLIAVASNGSLIDGDRQLCLFAVDLDQRELLANRSVVITVMSNFGLRQAMQQADITTIEVPVGDRNILTRLDAGDAALGGEQSGHLIFRDHATTGDGLLSGALLTDLILRSGKDSAELANEAMHQVPQVLLNIPVTSKSAEITTQIQEEIELTEARLANTGRVLVRASGTEAVIRVMVEATEETQAQSEAQHLAAIVQASIG
ncbi:MAG: phosphoglucosamine mutase [Actinomycetota bacterium]|nr:phosphoglucosamine mutase [Actinomycetota bacterium]